MLQGSDHVSFIKKIIISKNSRIQKRDWEEQHKLMSTIKNRGSCICQLNFPCWRSFRSCCRALLTIFWGTRKLKRSCNNRNEMPENEWRIYELLKTKSFTMNHQMFSFTCTIVHRYLLYANLSFPFSKHCSHSICFITRVLFCIYRTKWHNNIRWFKWQSNLAYTCCICALTL